MSKLISVRFDDDTIRSLNEFVAKRGYLSRNMAINAIISAVIANTDEQTLDDLVVRARLHPDEFRVVRFK